MSNDQTAVALTVPELARKIAEGELTSEDYVRACLDHISKLEPSIQAWAFLDPERAIAQAKAADEQRREGKGVGLIHGIPVGLKDIIDTEDMPTEHGCAAFKGRQAREDAACVTALRRAGAVILGKTVTCELATHIPSRTRNPHNVEHTAGGSSSGSAAAVAAGMVPIAVGTQTGGSVIRPASFCGIYGFKPTFGVIPRTGVLTQSTTLDTIGVFGRSLDDVAVATDALQGYDAGDAASLSISRPRLYETATQDWSLAPLFAFVKTHAWSQTDSATREAFGELIEELGGTVAEISIDSTTERGIAAARIVQNAEMAYHYGPILDRMPELVSKDLGARIEDGRKVRAADYYAALQARDRAYETLVEIFNDYGTILTPAALGPAPKNLATTGDPVMCAFWTYLGVPAVTLPLLEVDGMPLGVQLIGARRDDGRLLRTARWLVKRLSEAT